MRIERHTAAWFEALDAHIAARMHVPFAWGPNDCITGTADWVQTARGADPLAGMRGWSSAMEAMRVLEAAGGIREAIEARMGPAQPGLMAQAGDVVLIRHAGDRMSAGICLGSEIAAPGDGGLVFAPITDAEAAWRV